MQSVGYTIIIGRWSNTDVFAFAKWKIKVASYNNWYLNTTQCKVLVRVQKYCTHLLLNIPERSKGSHNQSKIPTVYLWKRWQTVHSLAVNSFIFSPDEIDTTLWNVTNNQNSAWKGFFSLPVAIEIILFNQFDLNETALNVFKINRTNSKCMGCL